MLDDTEHKRCRCSAGGPEGEDIDINPNCPEHGEWAVNDDSPWPLNDAEPPF